MKAVIIALGLTTAVGVGWYLMSAGEPSSEEEVATSDEAPAARRRGKAQTRERDGGREDFEPRRDGTLEQRVARLEDEVAMLRRQLAVRGRMAMAGGGNLDPEEIADDPVLDETVRSIVEEERERERERRDERRLERFEEFRTAALDELVQVAGLSAEQREGIDGLWSAEAERIIPLISAARSGDRSFQEVREELQGIRTETDEAAKAMLSESQFDEYDELRPRGPGGRRGGGGGGGPGDRGGPPR